jgi:hypothetical protein
MWHTGLNSEKLLALAQPKAGELLQVDCPQLPTQYTVRYPPQSEDISNHKLKICNALVTSVPDHGDFQE